MKPPFPPVHGYIFLCSNATEDECLERSLFGGTDLYRSKVRQVYPNDILYLYNYKAGRLHGTFIATSPSDYNIEPHAWEGQFPWQVRVKRITEYSYVTRSDFEDFIPLNRGMPLASLSLDHMNELEQRFQSNQRLPYKEKDYGDVNPALHWTKDRHKVRSFSEVTIDNWLFEHKIPHGYEVIVRVGKEEMFCDFMIPTNVKNTFIYIEYWGRVDNQYFNRKRHKQELYKKENLKLIELYPKDLECLADKLIPELQPYYSYLI